MRWPFAATARRWYTLEKKFLVFAPRAHSSRFVIFSLWLSINGHIRALSNGISNHRSAVVFVWVCRVWTLHNAWADKEKKSFSQTIFCSLLNLCMLQAVCAIGVAQTSLTFIVCTFIFNVIYFFERAQRKWISSETQLLSVLKHSRFLIRNGFSPLVPHRFYMQRMSYNLCASGSVFKCLLKTNISVYSFCDRLTAEFRIRDSTCTSFMRVEELNITRLCCSSEWQQFIFEIIFYDKVIYLGWRRKLCDV